MGIVQEIKALMEQDIITLSFKRVQLLRDSLEAEHNTISFDEYFKYSSYLLNFSNYLHRQIFPYGVNFETLEAMEAHTKTLKEKEDIIFNINKIDL